jgi:hypothetical protein
MIDTTSHQSMNLLERLRGIMEMGQRVAKGITHEGSVSRDCCSATNKMRVFPFLYRCVAPRCARVSASDKTV